MTRTAVGGLSLIGGSLALALGARGFDRDPERREEARRRGIDAADSLAEALDRAEVVFLAVPTSETPALLTQAAALAPGALISTNGSSPRNTSWPTATRTSSSANEGSGLSNGHRVTRSI